MIDSLFGNASQVEPQKIQIQFADVLVSGEQVTMAFKLVRDMFIFTNKRLILVDRQGVTGSKVEYVTIPYKSIKYFSVETAGHFDRDAELKIWLANDKMPTVEKELKKGIDIIALQKLLAFYVLA